MPKADDEIVEVQVKVPVCLTLRLERGDAESMYKEELCRVVDAVLQDVAKRVDRVWDASDRKLCVGYDIGPHWDLLPDDECELMVTETGLFPNENDDEG